jgi:hypothetical protein
VPPFVAQPIDEHVHDHGVVGAIPVHDIVNQHAIPPPHDATPVHANAAPVPPATLNNNNNNNNNDDNNDNDNH